MTLSHYLLCKCETLVLILREMKRRQRQLDGSKKDVDGFLLGKERMRERRCLIWARQRSWRSMLCALLLHSTKIATCTGCVVTVR